LHFVAGQFVAKDDFTTGLADELDFGGGKVEMGRGKMDVVANLLADLVELEVAR
jgi:hypothetical protein